MTCLSHERDVAVQYKLRLPNVNAFAMHGERSIRTIMDVKEYYNSLLGVRNKIFDECVDDSEAFIMHTISHNIIKEYDKISQILEESESKIFQQACREYQYALEAAIFGNYRHAFSSLRLSLELFTAAIYFSAHKMKMNLWISGSDDLQWSTIIDQDKGVFSSSFMKAFNPELMEYRNQYFMLAKTVYRECSEYVHGNPATHEEPMLRTSYDPAKVRDFHDKVSTVRLCVLFQFVARYLRELKATQKQSIEHVILDAFGTLPEIQASFEAA